MTQILVALLPLYRDEDLILCDMGLAKCYALVHSLAEQNGVDCIWADEDEEGAAAQIQQAREIIRNNIPRDE